MAARGAWANMKPMPNRERQPVSAPSLHYYLDLVEHFSNLLLGALFTLVASARVVENLARGRRAELRT